MDFASKQINLKEINEIPDSFPEYNGGVIAYKMNKRVKIFIYEWDNVHSVVKESDQIYTQAALRSALFRTDTRLATLPYNYNCVYRRPGCVNGKLKVFHGRLCEIPTYGASRRLNPEKVSNVLNSESGTRLFYPVGDTVSLIEPSILTKLMRYYRNYGGKKTVSKIYNKIRS